METDSYIQRTFWSLPDGRGLEEWVKKVKELKTTNWWVQNSHEYVKYSVGNIANTILITVYGVRWV